MSDEDVVIRVGNPIQSTNGPGRAAVYDLKGWMSVRVQRSCEQFPSVFEITTTELYPGDDVLVPVKPGDLCQILFTRGDGQDTVLTGYVDQVVPSLTAGQHSLTLIGRGKGSDLLDCSAVWPTGQFNNMSALTIAQKLAESQQTTITVRQLGGEQPIIPQLVFLWGETPYELIERVARFSGLLVYDDADGNLVLSRTGATKAASGVAEGKNLINGHVAFSMDQRFSEYRVRRLTFAQLSDTGADPEGDLVAVVKDQDVPRFRPRFIIAETPQGLGNDFAIARGEWEASRRMGRSTQVFVTIDSWRDAAGDLWAPNTIIDIDCPSLKVGAAQATTWVIATVTFRRDERGTAADLVIMPADAFDIFPVPLTPLLNTGPNP